MTGSLKQDQIDQYWRDGLLTPIGILAQSEAKSLVPKFAALKTRMEPWCSSKQILKPHVVSTWVNQLIHHASILDAVESLLGPDLLSWVTPGGVGRVEDNNPRNFINLDAIA